MSIPQLMFGLIHRIARLEFNDVFKQNYYIHDVDSTMLPKWPEMAAAEIGHVTYMDTLRMPNWHIIYE